MKSSLSALAFCLAALSISACQQETGGAVDTTQAGATRSDEPTDIAAPPALIEKSSATVSVTSEQLVGRFAVSSDVLDLKAAGSEEDKVFDLKTGGRYVFTGGVVIARVEGRWVLEENGTQLRVTPDQIHPESGEMLFAVTSRDTFLLLNPDGSPTNGSFGLARLQP